MLAVKGSSKRCLSSAGFHTSSPPAPLISALPACPPGPDLPSSDSCRLQTCKISCVLQSAPPWVVNTAEAGHRAAMRSDDGQMRRSCQRGQRGSRPELHVSRRKRSSILCLCEVKRQRCDGLVDEGQRAKCFPPLREVMERSGGERALTTAVTIIRFSSSLSLFLCSPSIFCSLSHSCFLLSFSHPQSCCTDECTHKCDRLRDCDSHTMLLRLFFPPLSIESVPFSRVFLHTHL